ncbi:AAA family ATPase [Dyella ginsengisoli]|uniref:AAA family ATPase n=1 Tax=Dyella ginsengisoli TaxID=363848 RepID=A0ABW8JW22_9GAMM
MESISIRNLRSLKDTGDVEIKPLTVLLGKNSAGKSTFLRSFPLLRQSSEEKTLNDILWWGDYVDFGTFWESLNNSAGDPVIEFSFRFSHPLRHMYFSMPSQARRPTRDHLNSLLEYRFHLKQSAEEHDVNSPIFSEYTIEQDGNVAYVLVDRELTLKKLQVNGEDLLPLTQVRQVIRQARLLPTILVHIDDDEIIARIFNVVKSFAHHRVADQTILDLIGGLTYGPRSSIITQLKSADLGDVWRRRLRALSADSDEIREIHRALFAISFNNIFDVVNSVLTASFSNVRYITPLRASAERYYRQRAIAVDEIAPNGDNLAMFLKSLGEPEARAFADWTADNMGFSVLVESHAGHVSILIEDAERKTRVNLADVGFGFSQVIPILAQVWQVTRRRRRNSPVFSQRDFAAQAPVIFLVEQPELHLHPRMQGRLMELFYKVLIGARRIGVDLRFIIETHSETMVAKTGQLLLAEEDLPLEDVVVYLFERDPLSPSNATISKSSFDGEGFLSNWPYDFFDGVGG